jgi:hypothetical protein
MSTTYKAVLHIPSANNYKQIVNLCDLIINGMSSHTDIFPSPNPTIEVLIAENAKLKNLITAAQSGNHADIAARNEQSKVLHSYLKEEVIYVNSAAKGNKEMILISGFDANKPASPNPIPGQAVVRKIEYGNSEHSAKLSIESLPYANYYKVEKSTTPNDEDSWIIAADNLKFYGIEVLNLTRGQEIWFRVAGGNTHGWGEWSQAVSFISK